MNNNLEKTNFTHLVSFPVIKGIENNIEVYLEYTAIYYPTDEQNSYFDRGGRYEFEFVKVASLWQDGKEIFGFTLSNNHILVKDMQDVTPWIEEVYCKNEDLSNSFQDFLFIQKAKEFCY